VTNPVPNRDAEPILFRVAAVARCSICLVR